MINHSDYETIEYHLVYGELIKAARQRGTVTYQELAHVVGLPLQGNHMGKRLGDLLGAVSENEVNQKRPMLSAVAVRTSGEPGDGFYGLAKLLKLLHSDDPSEQEKFWKAQISGIYDIWKQKFYTKK
jgi:hypothetical protein